MKLSLIYPDELDRNGKILTKTNAFIRKDGLFYMAKGYTGNNPWQQLESSALWVGRQSIGKDFIERYERHLEELRMTGADYTRFYDKRRILVEFYGFVLFCRVQLQRRDGLEEFHDNTIVPDPQFYGQEITLEQKDTLYKFYKINEGQDVSSTIECKRPFETPFTSDVDKMYQMALEHQTNRGNWHH